MSYLEATFNIGVSVLLGLEVLFIAFEKRLDSLEKTFVVVMILGIFKGVWK